MALTSTIEIYDDRWPACFEAEAVRLMPIFGPAEAVIHHIGSTAVPGLSAKPEIDVLVVSPAREPPTDWSAALRPFGYRRGHDLSIGHQFYKRDDRGVRTHKLHVCDAGHVQIARMLSFRDLLRQDPALRRRYQALKVDLERMNTRGIREYLDSKAPFIEASLAAAI